MFHVSHVDFLSCLQVFLLELPHVRCPISDGQTQMPILSLRIKQENYFTCCKIQFFLLVFMESCSTWLMSNIFSLLNKYHIHSYRNTRMVLPTFKADNASPGLNTGKPPILYKVLPSLPSWHTPKHLLSFGCPSIFTGIPHMHSFQGNQLDRKEWKLLLRSKRWEKLPPLSSNFFFVVFLILLLFQLFCIRKPSLTPECAVLQFSRYLRIIRCRTFWGDSCGSVYSCIERSSTPQQRLRTGIYPSTHK